MSAQRRDFLKQLFAASALPGLFARPGSFGALLDLKAAQEVNPDFDAEAFDFWSGFNSKIGQSAIVGTGKTRGARNPVEPVFLHHGEDGFRNASLLDERKLAEDGDVTVSVNSQVVKVGDDDRKTLDRLQNAQLRIDLAQSRGLIPEIEAMAYTVVGVMSSAQGRPLGAKRAAPTKGAPAGKSSVPTVQNISISSDAAWQKMQNIPLPDGKGRWALNLEAQKKDSLFCKVLQNFVKEGSLFAPMLSLPGIAMSALNSFNNLYGVLHAQPVPIIKSNPVLVFATQQAIQSTGERASDSMSVLLQPGTYVLMSAGQAPTDDQLKKLTLAKNRIVRTEDAKLNGDDLDAAAADVDVLKNVTYVTFGVTVQRRSPFLGTGKASG